MSQLLTSPWRELPEEEHPAACRAARRRGAEVGAFWNGPVSPVLYVEKGLTHNRRAQVLPWKEKRPEELILDPRVCHFLDALVRHMHLTPFPLPPAPSHHTTWAKMTRRIVEWVERTRRVREQAQKLILDVEGQVGIWGNNLPREEVARVRAAIRETRVESWVAEACLVAAAMYPAYRIEAAREPVEMPDADERRVPELRELDMSDSIELMAEEIRPKFSGKRAVIVGRLWGTEAGGKGHQAEERRRDELKRAFGFAEVRSAHGAPDRATAEVRNADVIFTTQLAMRGKLAEVVRVAREANKMLIVVRRGTSLPQFVTAAHAQMQDQPQSAREVLEGLLVV